MSKSVGNVVDPRSVILGGKDQKKDPPFGADVLRLWVASVDYTSDVMIGGRIVAQVADVYRKLRFTLRFLLGNLADYDPAAHAVPHAELAAADRYVLSRFAALVEEATAAYASFQFYRVYQALQRFVVLDLSNFYLDVAKDRLYVSAPGSKDRRAAQTVLDALLRGLLPLVAPLTPHMAEDAWQCLPYAKPTTSVFQAGWAAAPAGWRAGGEAEAATWRAVLGVRAEVNQQLEKARGDKMLGASVEARVAVHVSDPAVEAALRALQASDNGQDALRYLLLVSEAEVVATAAEAAAAPYTSTAVLEGSGLEVTVGVSRAGGHKCGRCWNYSAHVGADAAHPELCERCAPVVRAAGVAGQPALQPAAP
jgi:isoleucyl-tRNA synthetase